MAFSTFTVWSERRWFVEFLVFCQLLHWDIVHVHWYTEHQEICTFITIHILMKKENCRRDHNSNSFFFFKNFSFFNPYNTYWQLNDINIMKNMAIWKLTYNQKPLQKSHYWIHYLCTVWRFPIRVHSIQILHHKFSSTCPCKSLYKDNLFLFFMQLNNGTWQFES